MHKKLLSNIIRGTCYLKCQNIEFSLIKFKPCKSWKYVLKKQQFNVKKLFKSIKCSHLDSTLKT